MTSLETWRPAPGYEASYLVSDIGRVRSLPRQRTRGGILRASINSRGYRVVGLRSGEKTKYVKVHRLVCIAFHGPALDGMLVRHLDGDSLNNCAENLAWGNASENANDSIRHGTHSSCSRTACPRGHLLDGSNLQRKASRPTQRVCVACARAANWGCRRGLRSDHPDVRAKADQHYAELMQGVKEQ